MKLKPVLVAAVVGLFLYWVVQDPVGAAAMIHSVFSWSVDLLQLLAARIVQFLNALA